VKTVVALVAAITVMPAEFLAPYAGTEQHREMAYERPTRLAMVAGRGGRWWHIEARPRSQPPAAVRLFVRGPAYRAYGLLTTDWHLFGVDPPAQLFLFGADQFGRDLFSRVVLGGRTSVVTGFAAVSAALGIALMVGTTAAYYGGWIDRLLRGLVEIFTAIPWWYLIIAIRSCLPLAPGATTAAASTAAALALAAWPRPAQLVRSIVSSAAGSDHVVAVRASGASESRVLWRHLAPYAVAAMAASATVLIPRCIFAEVTLSFLGVGIAEPTPSWGNVLAGATRWGVAAGQPWMLLPTAAIAVSLWMVTFMFSRAHDAWVVGEP
jgi:peptide/nickel transport system permease protein